MVQMYFHRKSNAAFRKRWDSAVDLGTKALEDEAARRAFTGFKEVTTVVNGEGKVIETRTNTRFSDTLMIFLLKARDPKRYRENVRHMHGGDPDGVPIQSATIVAQVDVNVSAQDAAKTYKAMLEVEAKL